MIEEEKLFWTKLMNLASWLFPLYSAENFDTTLKKVEVKKLKKYIIANKAPKIPYLSGPRSLPVKTW
jgi:hypothetical protein